MTVSHHKAKEVGSFVLRRVAVRRLETVRSLFLLCFLPVVLAVECGIAVRLGAVGQPWVRGSYRVLSASCGPSPTVTGSGGSPGSPVHR